MKQTLTIALLLFSIGVFGQTKTSKISYQAKFDSANIAFDIAYHRVVKLDRLYRSGDIGFYPVINAINAELNAYYNFSIAKHDLDSVQMKEIAILQKLISKQLKELKLKQ